MGCRLTDNFLKTNHQVHYLEVLPKGVENLPQRGVTPSDHATVVPAADVGHHGVPDVAIGAVARNVVPQMKSGALMTLDPSAPLDSQIPHRGDIGCVIAHPCHPSVINWEPTEAAFRDFYGGGLTRRRSREMELGLKQLHLRLGRRRAGPRAGPLDDRA